MLYDLARYGDRGALWWELLPSSGLTEGHQLFGFLRRNLKNGSIRPLGGERTGPTHRSAKLYRYFLTARGYATLERMGFARQ